MRTIIKASKLAELAQNKDYGLEELAPQITALNDMKIGEPILLLTERGYQRVGLLLSDDISVYKVEKLGSALGFLVNHPGRVVKELNGRKVIHRIVPIFYDNYDGYMRMLTDEVVSGPEDKIFVGKNVDEILEKKFRIRTNSYQNDVVESPKVWEEPILGVLHEA